MRKLLSFICCFFLLNLHAQQPKKLNAAEIFQKIKKLNFLGAVLYIGAHPDDENTRLISYFSNERNARTAYLSLTRGDGGQNLIGPQLREQLGLIRTQELLAARRIDGGEQFFTRANDFGYSKTPEETLEIWDKEEVLSDMVWIIRNFKPDVIINRFDHRTPGTTHGHHTSSAILSLEAFEAAANPNRFPEQLEFTEIHQTKRAYFNTSPWFYGGQEAFEEASKNQFVSFDTGGYFPLRGLSNPEISSLSRSQHQSQGFGSTGSRGSQMEYLEPIKGDTIRSQNVFKNINTSWDKLEGGSAIGEILTQIEENFNFKDPAASLPQLLKAYSLIQELPNDHWRELKTKEIKNIIYASAGLFLEAVANQASATAMDSVVVNLEAINRSDFPIHLTSVELSPNNAKIQQEIKLENNKTWQNEITLKVPENTVYTTPYWLKEDTNNGMYKVEDQQLRGLPETPKLTKGLFHLDFDGVMLSFEKPIVYKYNDPVFGETYQPFEIVPEVSLSFEDEIMIFENDKPKNILVKLTAGKANIDGEVNLSAGDGWTIKPETHKFQLQQKGSSQTVSFQAIPPKNQNETYIKPIAMVNGKEFSEKLISIDYKHIPKQNLVVPSKLKVARLEIEKKGEFIGYIEGAGDVVPESLEQIGYRVNKLNAATISLASLKKYDAVVLGIRALNTVEALKYKQQILFDYVENGGNLIVQYNTNRGLVTENISPLPLELSRDRVTDETAEVRFLAENHPILNSPNNITENDFENWVQERGLYFPDSWSEEFTPILSMNDKNETPKNGSLMVARYGEGYFIYTGLSFFRQFPAGVPGAYRLFANMVSIGKE
ncbi:N-acetylglucosaminyl deacetylase, LmbE family [Salegentibacter holothuriorum]|uniref:N-acetylglucosaminyl deacetylase, LmbE family n=1 Tax=Salegentibacter holothuriorum TaxID=241145 RepID=A0A1T5A7C8_9FLAO|nr:PIG-L family deacetylase [Salegentibacter holothuriorum]SKB30932.1 N-acetylglucosaminyl deacetylase, LmbE family [Salegentibacter holothuriorum]